MRKRIDTKLVAKWMVEYQEMEKARSLQGLPPLTPAEAQRQGFRDGLKDIALVRQGSADSLTTQQVQTMARSVPTTCERAAFWTLSVRLTVLFILLAIGLATCGRLLFR